MEQVLNFPYEKNINLDNIALIMRKVFPKNSIKKWNKYVFLQKNFITIIRFSIKEKGQNRQLFYKTKMNLWLLLSIVGLFIFGICYYHSEKGYLRESDFVVLYIAFLTPIVLWIIYLVLKIGIISKVTLLLKSEIPNYLVNRTEYYFPPLTIEKKWQKDMEPVPWFIIPWFVIKLLFFIASSFAWPLRNLLGTDIYVWQYAGYVNALCSLLMIAIAIVFITKKYNHHWNIAKIIFIVYSVYLLLCSIFSIFNLWIYIGNSITIILSIVEWCLITTFAWFFYNSLRNSSSLYLFKACIIWCVISVFLFCYYQYITLNNSSIESVEYSIYSYWTNYLSTISTLVYLIGFLKAFFTLPRNTPQGIDIKL